MRVSLASHLNECFILLDVIHKVLLALGSQTIVTQPNVSKERMKGKKREKIGIGFGKDTKRDPPCVTVQQMLRDIKHTDKKYIRASSV